MLYGRDTSYLLLVHIGAFDAKVLPDRLTPLRSRGFGFPTLGEAAYREDPALGSGWWGAAGAGGVGA